MGFLVGVVTDEAVVVVVVEVVEGKIIGGVIICGTAVHVSSLTSPSLNCKSVSKFILKTKKYSRVQEKHQNGNQYQPSTTLGQDPVLYQAVHS